MVAIGLFFCGRSESEVLYETAAVPGTVVLLSQEPKCR